jgi:GAF domain-containing protein
MDGTTDTTRPRDPARVRLDRLERLQGLTAALSAAVTPEQVAAIIFDRGLGLVGARVVTLFWEQSPGQLELVHGLGLSDAFVQRFRVLGPDVALPSAEAWRTGEPVWLGSLDAIRARFPEAAALAQAEGDHAWAAIPLVVDRARGALGLRFDAPRAFEPEERDFVVAVARQCAQALERAQLYEAQRRLADRISSLQSTTAGLAAAVTPAEVAAVVFRALLGLGARDVALFYVVVPERLDQLFGTAQDPVLRQRTERVPIDQPTPFTDAARTGTPVWLDSPEAIRTAYPDLEADRARRKDGAWVAVPLRIEERSTGALVLYFPEGRSLPVVDRSFVLAIAQQCAQALERARLYEGQRLLTERLRQIHSTAAALSGAATPTGVAEAAFRGIAQLGASSAEIHAVDGPERLVLLARHGPPGGAAGAVLPIDAPAPAAEVVRTGKALWLESPEEIRDRFPTMELERAGRGDGAWAAVPLLAGGNTLGAITVAFPAAHRFETDEKAYIRMLAGPCAQALERARLYETASRLRADAVRDSATLDAMLSAAPVAMGLLDLRMRFLKVTATLARLSGLSETDHLGRTPIELLPGIPGEHLASSFQKVIATGLALEGDVLQGETPLAPGRTRRFVASWFPVRVGTEIVGVGVLLSES